MTPLAYRGQSDVARWCDVVPSTVSNWIRRYADEVPAPDMILTNEDCKDPVRGWLPERRQEWEIFAASRTRRATTQTAERRIQRTASMVLQGKADGQITEATAIRLLSELVGNPARWQPEEG